MDEKQLKDIDEEMSRLQSALGQKKRESVLYAKELSSYSDIFVNNPTLDNFRDFANAIQRVYEYLNKQSDG
ncbi:hypothetical protein K9M79_08135 [Candidatus Woesearchaeota archaeon]|nr:hypothetical protein [Candidatus Woesearchaeota archaeon]